MLIPWKTLLFQWASSTARALSQVLAGPCAGRTWGLQLLAPSLTCLTTWAELRTVQIWRRSGYLWELESSGCDPACLESLCVQGFPPVLNTCLQTRPNSLFQTELCQELLTSRARLWSCYHHALISLWECLPGLKPLAWASLAEETWEVATDPFGEQQTKAQHPAQDLTPAPGTQAQSRSCPCSPASCDTSGNLLESPTTSLRLSGTSMREGNKKQALRKTQNAVWSTWNAPNSLTRAWSKLRKCMNKRIKQVSTQQTSWHVGVYWESLSTAREEKANSNQGIISLTFWSRSLRQCIIQTTPNYHLPECPSKKKGPQVCKAAV